MKAVISTKYGPPEVLVYKEVNKPLIKENEILVKVMATTVSAGDCEMRSFKMPLWLWLPLRLYMGIFKPRIKILGQELSGVIEKVGKDVIGFKEGDEIFAPTDLRLGTYAQYAVLAGDNAIALKPKNLSFAEAAAIPLGGLNALHYLNQATIQKGTEVLIYGSTGSIGTVAVQLAKYYGGKVTAVCSTEKVELVKSLGADTVIDYKTQDYTKLNKKFDVVFETVGKTEFNTNLDLVKEGGSLLIGNPKFSDLVNAKKITRKTGKTVIAATADYFPAAINHLSGLYESGSIKSVIDREYKLKDIVQAHQYVDLGHKSGNVVILVDHDE